MKGCWFFAASVAAVSILICLPFIVLWIYGFWFIDRKYKGLKASDLRYMRQHIGKPIEAVLNELRRDGRGFGSVTVMRRPDAKSGTLQSLSAPVFDFGTCEGFCSLPMYVFVDDANLFVNWEYSSSEPQQFQHRGIIAHYDNFQRDYPLPTVPAV